MEEIKKQKTKQVQKVMKACKTLQRKVTAIEALNKIAAHGLIESELVSRYCIDTGHVF